MKSLQKLFDELQHEEVLHHNEIFNYAIPESWNIYGFPYTRAIRSKELLVNPYSFYLFTLTRMLKDENMEWITPIEYRNTKALKGAWLKQASVYSMMVRSASAWDHDRDGRIDHDDLYHLSDNGTFLKSIVLLPSLKRMGVNTILLHQPFTTAKTQSAHDYAAKEAVQNFQEIDEQLRDSLVPQTNGKEQCTAFIEACHILGIRVILEYCPGKLARDNHYIKEHPEWFYWIKTSSLSHFHAPVCHTLPQNTIPFTYTLHEFYRSADVHNHIELFKAAPLTTDYETLQTFDITSGCTIAPAICDQINTSVPTDQDVTIFRFFEDFHTHIPSAIKNKGIPYLSQDSIRSDLHPGRLPMTSLWTMLNENIVWYQKELGIDGIYLEKPYLLPEKLQRQFVKTARINHKRFAMIAEDAVVENSASWVSKGYDAISGNSGYIEHDIWNFKFHSFAYHLQTNACPMFAGSEFYDSIRISSLENGKKLANMLSVMNHFLPNGIPLLMNGIEAYEVQPMQLSDYGDITYLDALDKQDPRYRKQAYLDAYYFNYNASDLMVLPNLLEQTNHLRKEYISAISDTTACIPVWFDSPKDYGIGFTFKMDDKALMVICNTNIHNSVHLHVHTENMMAELSFQPTSIFQRLSTEDSFMHDIHLDEFNNIHLDYVAGEVKFIEFK